MKFVEGAATRGGLFELSALGRRWDGPKALKLGEYVLVLLRAACCGSVSFRLNDMHAEVCW